MHSQNFLTAISTTIVTYNGFLHNWTVNFLFKDRLNYLVVFKSLPICEHSTEKFGVYLVLQHQLLNVLMFNIMVGRKKMKKVLFVVNDAAFFISHRLQVG